MLNKVHVLAEGYSTYSTQEENSDSKGYMLANCSCSLVQAAGCNIIVDTMTAWDGNVIKEALGKIGLNPQDIDFVVCTHGHSDHVGCNYLFLNAKWHFIGACMNHANKYPDFEESFSMANGEVVIIKTPGHTLSCVSVLVYNTEPNGNTVGICGDLFEREEDVFNEDIWLSAGSEDPKAQRRNRSKLADMCSYIIPGHGKGFHVTEAIRNKLRSDLNGQLE
ncbi:metallo-beta-lactamase domain-containing protein 1 [Stomoxys calcitrans]|uniref:metallo-beta-lactamase domain-containing protein 1 n=1 Tax=Stomoxys calcitrans TaxID=35570 RepID=UPI0027E352C6|nr:metallo-beta-lactamase domain-containing protein 1 [Stomoxys calcitrans]